jgi:class 3 adenylate cyclase
VEAAPQAAERAPRAYTPRHLADKILQSKSALEGERKQVTVLFADVKGSVELAEGVDPEEWHRIMDRFFQILADGVHRFEGTVNQYTGDGIMALFGAPIAHEDHAQRAGYTALHLRDELRRYSDELRLSRGLGFSVRMGLNSGEVVVGKIGDDLRMDYTAQGHTVGLAARMEQLAAPNSIYLTEQAANLVSGYLALRDLGTSQVRGIQAPVHIFELEGMGPLRTRFEVSRHRGLTRFVGRDDDLQALEAALARCHEGNGQVVGLVGEAGVGKSRLCFEFLERCRARGLRTLEGRGVAHGKNVPFLPILQVFRAYYGITEQDDDRTAREKIAGRLVLLDEGFREVLPLVFEFLGVADPERPAPRMDPEARERQLSGILRRLVQSGRRESPIVTLIEDLHWIDGGSEAWLAEWVEAVPGTPGLLLVNFRPEYHADWMQMSYYRQLPLAPLGPDAIREVLADLLGSDPSIPRLAETIHARTGGNPFFTEEVVIEGLTVPPSVQAVLAARIDRLSERDKHVLQTAAVIGEEFSRPILEAAIELPGVEFADAIGALKASEFVYEQALYPVAEYAFKHPLTQAVAYGSQLSERRMRIHAAVARAIEEFYPDKLDERAALVAHHWEGAGEWLEAARWHRRAAEWAGATHAAEELRHWNRVAELVRGLPESGETEALALASRIGKVRGAIWLGGSAEELATAFNEGRALAERIGDLPALATLLASFGTTLGLAGSAEAIGEAIRHLDESVRVADRTNDPGLRAALRTITFVHMATGRLDEALQRTDEGLALAREDPDVGEAVFGFRPFVMLTFNKGYLQAAQGTLREGLEAVERGVELARRYDEKPLLPIAHGWASIISLLLGDGERAMAHTGRAAEVADQLGTRQSVLLSRAAMGRTHLFREEWDSAVNALEGLFDLGSLVFVAGGESLLAEAYLGRGDSSAARAAAEEAVTVTRSRGIRFYEIGAQLTRARILTRLEGRAAREEIEASLSRAESLVRETGGHRYDPLVHETRAELGHVLGDEAGRERELREAHRLYTEMGATGHAERVARELAHQG